MRKILKISGPTLRWAPFTIALALVFSTVVAQPIHAASILNTIRCAALNSFTTSSIATLKSNEQNMQTVFALEVNNLQMEWQLQDSAVSALRSIGAASFNDAVLIFQNRPGIFIKQTAVRTAAVNDYSTSIINALNTFQTNIDAARSSYREDMMTLVKSHQLALTTLVNSLVATITTALNTSEANCSTDGVVLTLVSAINAANLKLLIDGASQDVNDLLKALDIKNTRNSAFSNETTTYLTAANNATTVLADAFLTRQ